MAMAIALICRLSSKIELFFCMLILMKIPCESTNVLLKDKEENLVHWLTKLLCNLKEGVKVLV